jgi:predicted MFS family arabinose efflux permease
MPPQQRREEDHVDVTALREPLLSSPPWSDDHYATEDSSSSSSSRSSSSSASSTASTSSRQLVSRNVPLTLTHTVFYFAGSSIWSNNVLGAYIYMLQHDNPQAVGYISGVMGLTQFLCSFPAGRFADSHRRDTLLRLASVTGILAISATLFALYTQDCHNLVVALAVWGFTLGIGNTGKCRPPEG